MSDFQPRRPDESIIAPSSNVVAYLPATLAFVVALLAFLGFEVYSVLVGSWRWSLAGLITLFVLALIGSALQSYGNRRAR